MKIFTQTANSSAKPEMQDNIRKTILLVLFITLALTALADSVLLFNDLSSGPAQYYAPHNITGAKLIAAK